MDKFDFVVIGAGAAGASIAYELALTRKVCVLETEAQPGYHSTGRSAALFAPTYGGAQIRALTRASRSFFDAAPDGFTSTPLLQNRGCLYIARTDQSVRLLHHVDAIRASGGSAEVVSERRAMDWVPLLRSGYIAQAAYDADAMDIDVDALHQGYLRGARARGAKFLASSPVSDVTAMGEGWHIQTAEGALFAEIVVNAAGAWADEIARIFGASALGMRPLRRTALLIDPPPGTDVRAWPAVIDTDEQFYFKPDAGKLLLSPADESPDVPGDAQPEEMDIAIGVDRVQAALDIDVRRVLRSWAGLRTFVSDRVPVLGFDPMVSNFFWCAGQGGYGIQTAPAMGRLGAALASSREVPSDIVDEGLDVADLSPARASLHPVKTVESVSG